MLERQKSEISREQRAGGYEEFLEKYEDIDVVISENDNMTFGAIEAIREAGRTIGSDGDIIILSFDAVRDALKAIQTGDIAADFECNPLTAPLVERRSAAWRRGKAWRRSSMWRRHILTVRWISRSCWRADHIRQEVPASAGGKII